MTLDQLNSLSPDEAEEEFLKCCSCISWAQQMASLRPFTSVEDVVKNAESVWSTLGENEWLEAFRGHPKIGDIGSLKKKYAKTATWASNEQSGAQEADMKTLEGLAAGNEEYEKKFGFIFIVCATGKSASEMLEILEGRLGGKRENEIKIAAGEQNKITLLRLEKILCQR